MLKKILFAFLLPLFCYQAALAQIPLNMTTNTATGKLLSTGAPGCAPGNGASVAAVNYYANGTSPSGIFPPPTSGPGSHVAGGALVIDDPCDTTVIEVQLTLQWQKGPDNNWVHGVFFPSVAGYNFLGTSLAPASWIYTPAGCTGTTPCGNNPGTTGAAGYYFSGPGQSCCTGGGTTPTPCDNYGDPTYQCGTAMVFRFVSRVCNKFITGNSFTLRIRVTADGNTGCWSQADVNTNNLTFAFATVPFSTPLYNPMPAATPIAKTCAPAVDYTTTLTAGCGNSATVTWWDAAVGGNLVGTGSPFVYHSSTCTPGRTLYANCCPVILGNTCQDRQAFSLGACPPNIAMDPPGVLQPTCALPNGGTITAGAVTNGTPPLTYTLTPGGSNSSGIFTGLGSGTYTITVTDANGCSASQTATLGPVTGAGTITLSSATGTDAQTVCLGSAITNITYQMGGGAGAPTITGLPVGVTSAYSGGTNGVVTLSGTPTTPGTYTYTLNTGGACATTATGTITVGTAAIMTLSSAPGSNTQTVCIGTPLTPQITYAVSGGATGASATGLPAGVTGTFAGGVFTIAGSPSTVTGSPFTYSVVTSGGCNPVTLTGTITVNPNTTLTLTGSNTQTVCAGSAITNITYTGANGVTGITVTGLPAPLTGTYSGGTDGTLTISGSPTATGTFNYTVTSAGGCAAPLAMTGTIIVNPVATLTLSSAAGSNIQTVCVNAPLSPTPITYAVGGSATGATITGLPPGMTGAYAGGSVTIGGSPNTATGSPFTYTVQTTGGSCGTPALTGTITVTPLPTLALSSPAGSDVQTTCINQPLPTTPITYTVGGSATGATVTNLPPGMTGTYAGGVFTINGNPSSTAASPYTYTVTTTGGCTPAVSLTGTITVNPAATLTLTSAAGSNIQTVCVNAALSPTPITYAVGGSATGATITNLPPGMTGTFAGGVVTIGGSPNTATGSPFTYTVQTTGGSCGTPSLTGTITVTALPTLALSSPAGSDVQTTCINQPLPTTPITYTVGGSATGATVTNLPPGMTGTYAGGVFTINGNPSSTAASPYTYTVTTTGGCTPAVSLTGTITVNPTTTLTLTSPAPTANQTVNINTNIATITYGSTGGVTNITVTGTLPGTVTAVYSGGTLTISGNVGNNPGNYPFTVTTSGGCGIQTLTGSITVNDLAGISLFSGTVPQTVCVNTPIVNIVYHTTGGVTGASITTGPLPAGVTGVYGGGTDGTFTISGTPTVTGTFPYVVSTSGGIGTATISGSITINPDATIVLTSPASPSQSVCVNTASTTTVFTTGSGATGATSSNLPPGVTGVYSGGTNGTYTLNGNPTTPGTYNYTVTATGPCNSATITNGVIIVNPSTTVALTSIAGSDAQTVCINTAITNVRFTTANGATGASITTGALPAGVTGTYSGGTNGTFDITGTPTVSGTFPYIISTSGGCGTATASGSITVTANVTLALTSGAGSNTQTLCINTPLVTPITYATTGGVTGITVTGTPGLPTGITGTFTPGTGGNGTYTINGTPTAAGTFNYTLTTTGGCSTATLGGTITVTPAVTMTLTSAAATTSQAVCINTPLTNIVYSTTNGVTGATFTGLPSGVTGVFAATTPGNGTITISGTPTVAQASTAYTVTTTGGCGTVTLGGTITVNPDMTVTLGAAPANQTVCINALMTNITYNVANATGATVIGLPTGVTGTYAGGVVTISGTPTTATASPFTYTVMATGGCGTAQATGVITVNPAVTMTLTSLAATTSQVVCINTAITNIVYSTTNGVTGATFTGLPTGVTGAFAATTPGNGTITISGTPTVAQASTPYSVTTTGGCGTVTLGGTITVNPDGTITTTDNTAQTVCIGTPIAQIQYVTANGITNVTAAGLPAGVTGVFAAGAGGAGTYTINGSPTTVTGSPFTYTLTTVGGCASTNVTGTITVNPNVTMALSSPAGSNAQTLCINAPLATLTYNTTGGVTGITVTGTTGFPAGVTGTFTPGAGGTGVYTISGNPTVAGPFGYTLTTQGGCSQVILNGTITVAPAATIVLSSAASTNAQTVCINMPITQIQYTPATGATGLTVAGLPAGVTGTFIGGVLNINGSPNTTTGSPFTYTVTSSGGCGIATATGTITVNPDMTVTLGAAPANQTVCINEAMTAITYNVANATGANITGLPTGVTGVYNAGLVTISGTPTTTTGSPFSYTVTPTGGCGNPTLSGVITVNPAVTISLTSAAATTSQTLCENIAITNITYSTANGATGITATGLPAGVTAVFTPGAGGAGSVLVSGTGTPAGVYNYTITTTGGCATPSQSGTITVVAIPAKPTVTSPVNYCPGDAAHPISQDVTSGVNLQYYPTQFGGVGTTTAPTPSTAVSGSTTTYWVSQSTTVGACESLRERIDVVVSNPLVITNLPDVTICQGDTARFTPTVTPAATSYQWTAVGGNNSTIISPTSQNTGVFPVDTTSYILRATLGGCSIQQTVKVNVRWKPRMEAGANVAICLHDSTLIMGTVSHVSDAATPGSSFTYAWTPTDSLTTPGAIQTWAHPVRSTWYKITGTSTVADYGCDFTFFDSVKVIIQPVVHAFAGNDTIAARNLPHQLHGAGGVTYMWSSPTAIFSNPNSQNPTVTLSDDANIYVRVEDAIGCFGLDSMFVQVFDGPNYYIPNAFSPNGDGLNDVFRAIPPGITSTTFFRVFNRYGQLMFETSQWLKGWDGTYKGKPAEAGVYVWIIKGVDKYNHPIERKGTVMLVR